MAQDQTATLLVTCPDRPGLVAALAALLSEHGINILDASQHTDDSDGTFFQRIHFDTKQMDIDRDELESLLRIECKRYGMQWRLSHADSPKRVAIFVSKFEHCLFDLLLRHRLGELPCEIPLVISNHPDLRDDVQSRGIAYHVFPIDKQNKAEQEAREIELLEREGIDLIVLARYMQILSAGFTERFPGRIINIHHSTLPAFIGARPYHQAYERGVKLIGATAHYATADLDEGPIIAQEVAACSHADTVEDLVRKGRDVERVTLGRAVRAHIDDRIIAHGRRTVVFQD